MSRSAPDRTAVCPICRRLASVTNAPFCSAACRDRDLIAWLDEAYVLPGRPAVDDGTEAGS